MSKQVESVFIVATSSITALGDQERIISPSTLSSNKVEIPVEDHAVPYYAIKDVQLNKSFSLIVDLLIEQINQLLIKSELNNEQLQSTMLFLGSTSLDIGCISPDDSKRIWLSQTDKLGQHVVDHFGLHSLHFTFNTACTSSANALIYASNFIKQQKIEHAIVIGCEFFNQLSLNGFDSLDLISPSSVKPFSSARDGLILGEGIGAILLSKESNEKTQFEVLGGYSSCDDYSLTITEEDGTHIVAVINKALANASIDKSDVDLIKVHGTASVKSDLAEMNALHCLFPHIPNAIALKSLIGHTLGACGAIELALIDHFTQYQTLPHFPYQEIAEEELELPLIHSIDAFTSAKVMLFNHFGFGGNNAVVIIKKIERGLR